MTVPGGIPEIQAQVEARVKAEDEARIKKEVEARAESLLADTKAGGDDGINSAFVLRCLECESLGDGILYVSLHRGKYVFVHNEGSWYEFTGCCWRRDVLNKAVAAVETVAMHYAAEIPALGQQLTNALADSSEAGQENQRAIRRRIDQLCKRVKWLRKDKGRQECLKFAVSNMDTPLAISGDEFDQNPWLLACKNGVINLRTGVPLPGRPDDFLSRQAAAEYHGLDQGGGLWESTLLEIYDNDVELVSYLRRVLGYGLVGERSQEQIFPVLHGSGSNGKSIIQHAVGLALGDYSGPIASEMLLDQGRANSASAPSPDIMSLRGLRYAWASETDEGRRFSPARIKWLTGGADKLVGRNPHDKRNTVFSPSHLLILLTNHRPQAPDGDRAFWRRCVLIPHKIRFVEGEPERENERSRDKTLADRLSKCGPGILGWLVRGCLEWQQRGLDPPESVAVATGEYRDDSETISRFIEDAVIEGPGLRESAGNLYAAYSLWFADNINRNPKYLPSQRRFGSALITLERFGRKKTGGNYMYTGLALNQTFTTRIATL